MSPLHVALTALGWVGAFGAVTAYAMVSRGRWASSSRRFQVTNLVSAVLLCAVAAPSGAWPSVATNAVWVLVGVQALTMIARARRDLQERDARPAVTDGESATVADGHAATDEARSAAANLRVLC